LFNTVTGKEETLGRNTKEGGKKGRWGVTEVNLEP